MKALKDERLGKTGYFFATSVAVLCTFCMGAGAAQNAPAIMSKYGEIQSVNKYSSNPFWNPNSPYNQRMPTPIYATGADLTTGDCNRIVQNLVTEYCTNRNNCSGSQLSDVRPVVMVQLSQLPGHNFATSCGGYIDSIFENYKKTYGNTSTNNIVKPGQQKQTTVKIENPFTQKKSAYEIGVEERTAELEQLQSVTTPTPTVNPTDFPKTVADLSFTDRLANTTAGYEPYANLKAYKTPIFETEQEYFERMKTSLEHNIHYELFGGKDAACPKKYYTGKGITISCVPTREHSTFIGWCTDATLKNCAATQTIDSNSRDDKTFYAKWKCDGGYIPDGNKCVKPAEPKPKSICPDDVKDYAHEQDGKCVCNDWGVDATPLDINKECCPHGATRDKKSGECVCGPDREHLATRNYPTRTEIFCPCKNGGDVNDDCNCPKDKPFNATTGKCEEKKNCRDPHMDPADCTCKGDYTNDTQMWGTCKCKNGGDPDNKCDTDTKFIIFHCPQPSKGAITADRAKIYEPGTIVKGPMTGYGLNSDFPCTQVWDDVSHCFSRCGESKDRGYLNDILHHAIYDRNDMPPFCVRITGDYNGYIFEHTDGSKTPIRYRYDQAKDIINTIRKFNISPAPDWAPGERLYNVKCAPNTPLFWPVYMLEVLSNGDAKIRDVVDMLSQFKAY